MKVITFSLWGNHSRYLIGTIKNIELAKIFYPDFFIWIYIHKETVPDDFIQKLHIYNNIKIIYKTGNLLEIKPMMWRFSAIDDDDVELMLSRDTDTRFLLREKLAVEEFIKSDSLLHIMRDHPWHNNLIQGGMFGVKKSDIKWNVLMDKVKQNNKERDYDQTFLCKVIYPLYKDKMLIHASFNKFEKNLVKDFPLQLKDNDYRFVGEYVYDDDTRNETLKQDIIRGFIIHKGVKYM